MSAARAGSNACRRRSGPNSKIAYSSTRVCSACRFSELKANGIDWGKRDEELRLLAERGGVIGIYIMPYLRKEGQVMADDVIRHIEYAVNLCGEDHVGIGTDGTTSAVNVTPQFKKDFAEQIAERQKRGISAPGERADSFTFAPDLNTPNRLETIAALLSRKGHADARIEKILGGNFARLFRDVIV